jgi:hypothetical protein
MDIHKLRTQLLANAKSNKTHLTSDLGWLRILLTDEEYAAYSPEPFDLPVYPGACPKFTAPVLPETSVEGPLNERATRRRAEDARRAMDDARYIFECAKTDYTAAKADWATYTLVLGDLRHQVLAAVDPIYFNGVTDDSAMTGLGDVHPQLLLGHLVESYGTLTDTEIEKHWHSLEMVADPSLPIAAMFAKVSDVRQLLANVDPVSDKKAITKTLASLAATGAYRTLITTWADRTEDKTWKTFKAHCIKHDKRLKEETTAGEAYGTTGVGLSAVTPRATPNGDRKVATMGQDGRTASRPPRGEDGSAPRTDYCWTHGLVRSPETNPHNSKTCRYKRPGHCEGATLFNRMDGNDCISIDAPSHKRPKRDIKQDQG